MNFNYGEYIFQQLINTEFIQKKLSGILAAIIVNIIQVHIVSIGCWLFSFNSPSTLFKAIDFTSQIAVSVAVAVNVDYIYMIVSRFDKDIYIFTQYLINNYTLENYRFWKRALVLSVCAYACINLLFVTVTNALIFYYIIQYAICFLIIEQFEQRRVQTFVHDYRTRPRVTIAAAESTPQGAQEQRVPDLLISSYWGGSGHETDKNRIVYVRQK